VCECDARRDLVFLAGRVRCEVGRGEGKASREQGEERACACACVSAMRGQGVCVWRGEFEAWHGEFETWKGRGEERAKR